MENRGGGEKLPRLRQPPGAVLASAGHARSSSQYASWVGIVDDDESLRVALARALRGYGIDVRTFESAEEFLDRPDTGQPECLVLDIHLGGLSGFELQDLLLSAHASPPIIFITAHDDMFADPARREAAFGYLQKPFDIGALVELLRPHLRAQVG